MNISIFKKSMQQSSSGNICRSPIAEAVFLDAVRRAGVEDDWEVDSAAISDWHVGRPPNERAWSVIKRHNLEYNYNNRSRQIEDADFRKFDFIFGMDEYNISELQEIAPADKRAEIYMLGQFDPQGRLPMIDPYGVSSFTYRPLFLS